MPWDRFTGVCIKAGGKGSLYAVSVFEIMDGEVTVTKPAGDMPDINDHAIIKPPENKDDPSNQAVATIITKLHPITGEVENGKLYLKCLEEHVPMWRRVFTGFGGLATPPKYDGVVTPFNKESVGEGIHVSIGDVGNLHLVPITSVTQQLVQSGPYYSEVCDLHDGTGSTWNDGEFNFTIPELASIGKFYWNAPAQRPDPSHDAWWLRTAGHSH